MREPQKQRFQLFINVRLQEISGMGGALNVSEEVNISVDGFMHIAKILGQFHDLTEEIKKQNPL